MTIVEAVRGITGGVDTHRDVHVAAALDPLGGLLGTEAFSADPAGYKALLGWLEGFGDVTKVGVEGTGSYGLDWPVTCAGWASRSSKSTDRIARSAGAVASPIPSTPSKQPGPLSVAERMGVRSRGTVQSRPSGCWWLPSALPARLGSRRSSRCATSATAHLSSSDAG